MITRKEEIKKGKWLAWISTDGLNTEIYEFNHEPTEKEATNLSLIRETQVLAEKAKSDNEAEIESKVAIYKDSLINEKIVEKSII